MNPKLRRQILDRDGGRCQECGAPATAVDHIWPAVHYGTDDPENLRAICRPCNSRKRDTLPGVLPLYGSYEKRPRATAGLTPHAVRCARAYWARRRAAESTGRAPRAEGDGTDGTGRSGHGTAPRNR